MKRDATAQINQFNSSDHQKNSIPTKKFKEPTFVVWRKKTLSSKWAHSALKSCVIKSWLICFQFLEI